MRVGDVTGTGTTEKTIDALNKLLRGELSAVETYSQGLERLGGTDMAPELEECRRSHEERVRQLQQQVIRLGGKPSEGSGPWGGFARMVAGGSKLGGEKGVIAALEEGEDHGLKLYRDEIDHLDVSARDLVTASLLPAQERTHRTLSALKHRLH